MQAETDELAWHSVIQAWPNWQSNSSTNQVCVRIRGTREITDQLKTLQSYLHLASTSHTLHIPVLRPKHMQLIRQSKVYCEALVMMNLTGGSPSGYLTFESLHPRPRRQRLIVISQRMNL